MNNDLISRSALLRTCEAREVDAACNRQYGYLCSRCNLQADNDFDYCPNCGAKMDRRTDDENHHL